MQPCLKIKMIKETSGRYLELVLPPEIEIAEHQLEMLWRQTPPGILVPEKYVRNLKVQLLYPLNNYLSLADYLEQALLSKEELLNISENLVEILLAAKNYLLYASSFYLVKEYVFLTSELEVKLLYLPWQVLGEVNQNFQRFLVSTFTREIDFPQNLKTYLFEPTFNLKDFLKELRKSRFWQVENECLQVSEKKVEQMESLVKKKFPRKLMLFVLWQLLFLFWLPWFKNLSFCLLFLLLVILNLLFCKLFSVKRISDILK